MLPMSLIPTADRIREQLQDIRLASTPVFTLLIQVATVGKEAEPCGPGWLCSAYPGTM